MTTIPIRNAYFCVNCENVFDLANRISVMTCPVCGSSVTWPMAMWMLSKTEQNRLQPWRKETHDTDQQRKKSAHPCCQISVGAI